MPIFYNIQQDGEFVEFTDNEHAIIVEEGVTTTVEVLVPTVDDDADEADGSVTVRLLESVTAGSGARWLVTGDPGGAVATVAVRDNDLPSIRMSVVSDMVSGGFPAVTEGGSLQLVFQTDSPLADSFEVPYHLTETGDYFDQSRLPSAVIESGEMTATVSIATVDDGEDERTGTATFTLLRAPPGFRISSDPAESVITVHVADNDNAPSGSPIIGFDFTGHSGNRFRVDEDVSGGMFNVTLTLNEASESAVYVEWEAYSDTNSSAVAPDDYTSPGPQIATFAAGDTSATISIPIVDDDIGEDIELFVLELRNPVNATLKGGGATLREDVGIRLGDKSVSITSNLTDIEEGDDMLLTFSAFPSLSTALSTLTVEVERTGGGDHVASSNLGTQTLTVNLRNTATVSIPTMRDSLYERDGVVSVRLLNSGLPSGYIAPSGRDEVVFNIADNDLNPPDVPLWLFADGDDHAVEESAGEVTFTVILRPPPVVTAYLGWSVEEKEFLPRATAGEDFEDVSGTLTFEPGVTQGVVRVRILEDDLPEGNERFFIRFPVATEINLAIDRTVGQSSVPSVMILANDFVPEVRMVAVDDEIEEGENAVFRAVSDMALSAADSVVIPVSVSEGDGESFVAGEMPVSVTFAAGANSSDEIMVYTDDDNIIEETGTITARLFQDDMTPPRWSMVGEPATVSVMDNDAGDGDEVDEGTEVLGMAWVTIPPASSHDPTVVGEDEIPNRRDLTVLFSASPALTEEWNVEFEVIENGPGDFIENEEVIEYGNFRDLDDPANVVLPVGETNKLIAMKGITDDNEYDGFGSATLRLLNAPPGYIIDPARASVTYQFVDNDPLPAGSPNVAFDMASYRIAENGGMLTAEVELDATSRRQVFVDWEAVDGSSGLHGRDYRGGQPPETLVFEPGETTKTVSVEILDDDVRQGNKAFSLRLTNPLFAQLGTHSNPGVTLTDNEHSSLIVLSSSPSVITEGDTYSISVGATDDPQGGNGRVQLDVREIDKVSGLTGDHIENSSHSELIDRSVYIDVSTTSPSHTGSPVTLNYVPDNPDTTALNDPLNAFLKTEDDDLHEGDTEVEICIHRFIGQGSGTLARNYRPASRNGRGCTRVTILDNDEPAASAPFITVSPLLSRVEEGETAMVTVNLSSPATGRERVRYTASNIETADDDYTGASGTLAFALGQTSRTISIPITDDIVYETDEAFRVTLSDPINAFLGGERVATVFVPINDTPPTVGFSGNAAVTEGMPAILTLSADKNFQAETAVRVAIVDSEGDYLLGDAPSFAVFGAGQSTATFAIPTRDDDTIEDDGSFTAAIARDTAENRRWRVDGDNARDTILVMDNELPQIEAFFHAGGSSVTREGTQITFGARTTEAVNGAFTVPYSLVESGIGNHISPETELNPPAITIPDGQTVRSVTVNLPVQTGYQGDSEAVFTIFGAPEGFEIKPDAQSVRRTIIDTVRPTNPSAGLPVLRFVGSHVVNENVMSGSITLTVTVTPPVEDDQVLVTLTDGPAPGIGNPDALATAGQDYRFTDQTLTFAPGEAFKTFDVTIIDDDLYEPGVALSAGSVELFGIYMSDPVNAFLNTNSNQHIAQVQIVVDDDKSIFLTAADTDIVEGEPLVFTLTPVPDFHPYGRGISSRVSGLQNGAADHWHALGILDGPWDRATPFSGNNRTFISTDPPHAYLRLRPLVKVQRDRRLYVQCRQSHYLADG